MLSKSVYRAICSQIVAGPDGGLFVSAFPFRVGLRCVVLQPLLDLSLAEATRYVQDSQMVQSKLPCTGFSRSPAYLYWRNGLHICMCDRFPNYSICKNKVWDNSWGIAPQDPGLSCPFPVRGVLNCFRNPRFPFGVSQAGSNLGNLSGQLAWAGLDRSPCQMSANRVPRVTQATLGNYYQCADPTNPSLTAGYKGKSFVRFAHPCPVHGEWVSSDLCYGVRSNSGSGCAIKVPVLHGKSGYEVLRTNGRNAGSRRP